MNKPAKHPHIIEETFDWDDPQIYQWVICGSKKSVPLFVAGLLAITLLVPALACILMLVLLSFILAIPLSLFGGVSAERLGAIKFWSGIVILILLVVITLYFLWLAWKGNEKKKLQAQSHLHEWLTTSIGITFGVMVELIRVGFTGQIDSLHQWLLFSIDNLFHSLFLDILDLFNFRLSNIEPQTWYARFATVLLRIFISAGLIDSFLVFYRRTFKKEDFYGTVKDCFWKCQNLLDRNSLQLKRGGKVELFVPSEGFVSIIAFVEALDQRDYEASKADRK